MASQLPPGVDPATLPLGIPPPGRIPNFANPPDSQAPIVLGTGVSFGVVSLVFVILRIWTNLQVSKKLAVDDYLCVLAWMLATGYLGLSAGVGHLERHSYDIPLAWLDANVIKIYFASNFMLGPTMWAAKTAILALYYRLFSRKAWLRWSCYIGFMVLTLVYWTSPIIAGVYCAPHAGQPWNLAVLLNCEKVSAVGPAYGSIAVAADIFLLLLPLPIIFTLKMAMGRKIALAAVFMTGVFALAASIISLVFKTQIFRSDDPNWNAAQTYAGVIVENYLTVIVSCAPAMSALWINKLSTSPFVSSLRALVSSSSLLRSTKASEKSLESHGQSSTDLAPSYFPGGPRDGAPQVHVMQQHKSRTAIFSQAQEIPLPDSGIYRSTRIDQSRGARVQESSIV